MPSTSSEGQTAVAPAGSVAARFDPHPACSSSARRFVTDTCRAWDLAEFADDAALCAGELVSNAILHARAPFTVGLRRLPGGLRMDVHDDRPDLWPVLVPAQPIERELATTGRGLAIVAALAARWGCFTTGVAKTIWVEFSAEGQPATEPSIELANVPPPPDARVIEIVDLPTRAAIASGMQIDDVVREVQLSPDRLEAAEADQLAGLLDRSARLRLIGRQEAFKAAAAGQPSFTLELPATAEEVAALGELTALLGGLAAGGDLAAAVPSPEVAAMRRWLVAEIAAQLQGALPRPCGGLDSTGPEPQARSGRAEER